MDMHSSDIFVYICPDDRSGNSDLKIHRFTRCYLAETGLKTDIIPTILRPVNDRPRFSETGFPFFSVSHSGDLWVCAISSRRIGLDIQRIIPQRNIHAIARRFFHPDEITFLEQTGYKNFYTVWAAKECYVKYTGSGIDETFSEFSVINNSGLSREINGLHLRHITFDIAYEICICYNGDDDAIIHLRNET